jgi:phosphoesterase RecJ-like protein
MEVPAEIIETVKRFTRPVIVGHVRPDADCLGSMLAFGGTLQSRGVQAAVSLPEGTVSRRLSFLPEWAGLRGARDADFRAADGFIVVDTAKLSRCSVAKPLGEDWLAGRPLVNIDHHESNTLFGRVNWVVPQASSSAELIYRVIRAAGWDLSPRIAALLYAGVHSDTIGFSLPTTTADALEAAATLVRAGADVNAVGMHLYRNHSRNEFELLRLIYDNTRVTPDGQIAYSTASHAELTRLGCSAADIDDQVNIPRSVDGIRLAILFTEGRPGRTRVNLRGERGTTVLPIALALGGGGHVQSAGAIIDAPLDEAVLRVLAQAAVHMTNRPNSIDAGASAGR